MLDKRSPTSRRVRLTLYLLFGSATALAINAGRMAQPIVPGESQAAPPIPYTVALQETLHRSGAVPMQVTRYVQCLREDGSQVSRMEFLDAPYGRQLSQRSIRFASGARVQIDEIRELRTSMFIEGFRAGASQRDPASKCLRSRTGRPLDPNEIVLAEESVGPWRAMKIAVHNRLSWFGLDFGCALLKQHVDIRGGTSEQIAVSVELGVRDPDLFNVPADYKEVQPSVFMALAPGSEEALRRDELYRANRIR